MKDITKKPHIYRRQGVWIYDAYWGFGQGCSVYLRRRANAFCVRMNLYRL